MPDRDPVPVPGSPRDPDPDPDAEFERYRDAMLALLAGRDPVEVLATSLDRVRAATAGAPAAVLTAVPAPGEWSAREVLQHLADNDLAWGMRVRLVVTADRPPLTPYDEEAWIARFGDLDGDPAETLARWAALRRANVAVLRSLSAAEWARTGRHPARGEQSVREIACLVAGHDLAHLDQVERALEAARAGRAGGPR